jgi:hypothetical protein
MLPSLARADAQPADGGDPTAVEPASAEPWDDAPAAPAEPGAEPAAPAGTDVPEGVLNPDLAAEAPGSTWSYEGGGNAGIQEGDPRVLNRKIRKAGRTTLVGGGVAVIGGALAISGAVLLFGVRPDKRLRDLSEKNGGSLPPDNEKRQRLINMAEAGPILVYVGLGLLAAGVITATIARIRFKKLREQRRKSTVAFMPIVPIMPTATSPARGFEMALEVKF